MKKALLSFIIMAAAVSVQSCNSTETHDRSVDHPAGQETGPQSGEEAREKVGDDPNDQGKQAADDYGDQNNR